MPKRSDTGSAAVMAPRTTPEAVAAAAAEKSESIRRQALAADWRSWRELVATIADGQEPDGKQLGQIATLAARLRLPEGALASAVQAVGRERELREDEDRARARLAVLEERGPALASEVEAARRRLDELVAEQRRLAAYPLAVAATIRAVAEHRSNNPLAFLSEAELVERSIRSQSRGVLTACVADEEGWST